MADQIILIVFIASTVVQILFWLFFFGRLAFYNWCEREENSAPEDGPPVTIIICAHNEAENLKNNLYRFLNQNYRSYEVLVVDHKSTDTTRNIVAYLQSEFSNLRVIDCDDPRTGKKFALAKGIEQSKNKILLLTDADCVPAGDSWLRNMVAGMNDKTQIVLGFAPYFELPGPLNKFIRFEACFTAMQYMSFSLSGLPYMGVGRNLAYKKELFEQKGGFQKHENYASGDDDLFINEVARSGNTSICLNPGTFAFSMPKTTWKTYFAQKTRHFSTGKLYKLHHKVFLSILAMSHWLHYLGGIYIILKISIIFAIIGYAVRMCVVLMISSRIFKRFQHQKLVPWIPALDAALVFYYMMFSPAILMNINTQKWN